MPSIRLTPLQPTSFDEWRDRVLTTPRDALVLEQNAQASAGDGSFRTLSAALVGTDSQESLASELRKLSTVLTDLLTDKRGNAPITIGQSSSDIRTALGMEGAVPTAIGACAAAIAALPAAPAPPDDDDQDGFSIPATPGAEGFIVLKALNTASDILVDRTLSNSQASNRLKTWLTSTGAQEAETVLGKLDDEWLKRFRQLAQGLSGAGAVNERLGQLAAFQFDITRQLTQDLETTAASPAGPTSA